MEKVRFGVLGCGNIGKRHIQWILQNSRAELAAVCDLIADKADLVSQGTNARVFYDINSFLKADIDVVNVCTPSGLHGVHTVMAFEAGKHVLCEKPMSINLKDADKICAAEKKSGKSFMLVKQNRYNPPIVALKNVVHKEELGDIVLINCNVLWNRRKEYYEEADWRGTISLDGGALMTQCSHFLDLMVWIGGPVSSVYAKMANITHPYIETEDCGFITLMFENGSIGSLQYTTCVYNQNLEGSMTVLGTQGSIKIGGKYINELELWDVKGIPKPHLTPSAPPNDYGSYQGSMSNHDKVINNTVEVILDKVHINANSMQGRQSIEIMQAAYISARQKRQVELPLKGKDYEFRLDKESPIHGKKKSL